jgi:hypothetical protein
MEVVAGNKELAILTGNISKAITGVVVGVILVGQISLMAMETGIMIIPQILRMRIKDVIKTTVIWLMTTKKIAAGLKSGTFLL